MVMKKRTLYKLILLLNIFLVFILFLLIGAHTAIFEGPTDVDKIENGPYAGCYLVTDGIGAVKIIDLANREIKWATEEPSFFVHNSDIMPDGKSVLIADTGRERVIEMNLSNKAIIWEWNAMNSTQINWTAFGLQHGWNAEALAIVQNTNPATGYYAHLNTVQFVNGSMLGRTYDTILISLRNLDLIIEVNYTAKQPSDPAYMNITWHYGIPGNRSLMYHQHSPKRLSNGHLLICDSERGRVLELNQTNHVVWEYWDKVLRWVRDCDYIEHNGNYLITDSDNNRLIEVNGTTNEIVRTFTRHIVTPYSAEYTSDGYIVVGMPRLNQILIIDYETGDIVDVIGFSFVMMPAILMIFIIIGYQAIDLIFIWRGEKGKTITQRLKSHKIHTKLILMVLLVLAIVIFYYIISFSWHYGIWRLAEQIPRPSW